jgi:hypothetical protein
MRVIEGLMPLAVPKIASVFPNSSVIRISKSFLKAVDGQFHKMLKSRKVNPAAHSVRRID